MAPSRPAGWIGIDVGGANLKVADTQGLAREHGFPLWQAPQRLAAELAGLLADCAASRPWAVTMTGELADCFATKAEGVRAIVQAVQDAAPGRRVAIYLVGRGFAPAAAALTQPLRAAASNWHALASLVARWVAGERALLVDVGSTTCDVVALGRNVVLAEGETDPERLQSGELVYTGVQRSPVCALVRRAWWRGRLLPVAQEVFATSGDAYLLLGEVPEQPACMHTADGRPATRGAALARLARMVCADETLFDAEDGRRLAQRVARRQRRLLARAIRQVVARSGRPDQVFVSGQGEFLARRTLARVLPGVAIESLSSRLSESVSRVAPAYAVAVLAEQLLD